MLLGLALLVCLVSVPLCGGNLGRLADLRLRGGWVLGAGLGLQIVAIEVIPGGPRPIVVAMHVVSYALVAACVVMNVRVAGLPVIAIGGAANALAIAANGGVMPARPGALRFAGLDAVPGHFANSGAVEHPALWWLGDVFAVPASWPLANVFSVGDLLLVAGSLVLLHSVGDSRAARALRRGPQRPAPAKEPATAG